MSDENATSPDPAAKPSAEGAPRARRVSNPRTKKPAKAALEAAAEASAPPAPAETPAASKFPDFSESSAEAVPRGDWPEPEPASSGASASPENPKRKRRRKKGKGGGQSQNAAPTEAEAAQEPAAEGSAPQNAPQAHQPQRPPQQHQQPRPKLDPEFLAKLAWKIYLSEVSEEGIALIGDNDAKELSRRCFRLAEIFMEEQAKRR